MAQTTPYLPATEPTDAEQQKRRLVDFHRALIRKALLGTRAAAEFLASRDYPMAEALALLSR